MGTVNKAAMICEAEVFLGVFLFVYTFIVIFDNSGSSLGVFLISALTLYAGFDLVVNAFKWARSHPDG